MNITRNLIFCILVSLQNISCATEKNNTLSEKAQIVAEFLDNFNVDQNRKNEIIAYFNQSPIGIPICYKLGRKKTDIAPTSNENSSVNNPQQILSIFKKYPKIFEEVLLGYTWQEWKNAWYLEKLRRNNIYHFGHVNYLDRKTDEKGTEAVANLRNKVKLSPQIDIPVVKNPFLDDYLRDSARQDIKFKEKDEIWPRIEMNSILNAYFPNTIDFRAAHELSHHERGLWAPKRNLAATKIILGAVGLLLHHQMLLKMGINSWLRPIMYGLGSLGGVAAGSLFKNYFQRKEEKACDLRALEIIGSDKGVAECFSTQAVWGSKFIGDDWVIREIKILRYTKGPVGSLYSNPLQEALYATHPNNAERAQYCKEYAKKLGYHS